MFGMGTPEEIGTGLDTDRAILLDPNLHVFIIPAGTYGEFTPEPVVTVAVDKLLVVRSDIPEAVIYDLISEIIRLRPALSAIEPTIFHGIGGDFDASKSTFVMHPGSQSYIERNEPSIYERYSGIAEVGVTILLALLSGTIAATRIYSIRRKNRVDQFYADVIAIRKTISNNSSSEERRAAITEVRILQTRAFDLLINEKLAADESFSIFVTLSNNIIDELKQPTAPDWSYSD
jgi:hypothetical protein